LTASALGFSTKHQAARQSRQAAKQQAACLPAEQPSSKQSQETYLTPPCIYPNRVVDKAAGMFSMRHSHQDTDSTWNTTWFSTFWRQRISSTVTATNAAFVNRILQRDSVFQQDGPSIAKASRYPRFYNYDPKLNRRSCNHRNPHSTRNKTS